MTDTSPESSRDELRRKLEAKLGPEILAALMALPLESRKALLDVPSAPDKLRNKGGRPKGTGTDYSLELRRMAELQVDNPRLTNSAAARQVAQERNNLQSAERLRKLYGENKEALLAAERKRREPPRPARKIATASTTIDVDIIRSLATRVAQDLQAFLEEAKYAAIDGNQRHLMQEVHDYTKRREAVILDVKRFIEAEPSPHERDLVQSIRELQLASRETWQALRDFVSGKKSL